LTEFEIQDDGKNHINVYSKSRSVLGRLLSNFAHTPIELNGLKFESIESWWYWMKMNNINKGGLFPIFEDEQVDAVRIKIGADAKSYFRSLYKSDSSDFSPSKEELKEAYKLKLDKHPNIKQMLIENKLPIDHYYVMFDKKVATEGTMWTAKLWEEIKNEL
jgi:predicted NAD-dependent protein-ADP-ribosyltransferase YbiA (DUF1768 family)